MIARVWHATANAEGAEAYRRHFTESVLPALQRLDGHRGAYLLRLDRDDHVELQVMTLWESLDAVRRFTGPDFGAAVVEPEAKAALTGFDASYNPGTVAGSVTSQFAFDMTFDGRLSAGRK